jgi:hypothetical protein
MTVINTVFTVIGIIILLIGTLAFFNPSFTRWINFPGGPKIKAIAATITGVILIIIGILIEIPME